MDMTFFVLIVRLRNNVRLKILETKNATKIRKEVSGFQDHSTELSMTYLFIFAFVAYLHPKIPRHRRLRASDL